MFEATENISLFIERYDFTLAPIRFESSRGASFLEVIGSRGGGVGGASTSS